MNTNMSMSSALIECRNLEIGYERGLLPSFNLSINRGSFLGIAGPNGAGKTTLIKTLTNVLKPIKGEVFYSQKLSFGFVPQRHSLPYIFPLSAEKVIEMGLFRNNFMVKKDGDAEGKIEKAAEMTGVSNLKKQLFSSMSGGQQQRVLIARALVSSPDIIFLDEPVSGLDMVASESVTNLVKSLNNDKRQTVVMISHSLEDIEKCAESLILMSSFNNFFASGLTKEILTKENIAKVFGGGKNG